MELQERMQLKIQAMQGELLQQHTGRMAAVLAAPNASREIANKHRPTHWINISKQSGGRW